MTRAVDTSVLVYAHREEAPHHASALSLLRRLAVGPEPWGLPWPCVYEFLRVVTHPRVFHPPTPLAEAVEIVLGLAASPSVRLLSETERHGEIAEKVFKETRAEGNLVHDAHIAALLVEHGFDEILTTDEDFRRFPGIRPRNPFR